MGNQINKPIEYFNTKLYTGNGTTGHNITGVGFQPDWLWIKERSSTSSHFIYDAIRNVNVKLSSNTTDADSTVADSMTSFDSDGFTVGNNGATNESGQTYASWNWLAGGTASSNTDGSITSNVSVNTTSGFSIVSYTGNGVTGATVGHGLGTAPAMVIVKERGSDTGGGWRVWHKAFGTAGNTDYIFLNQDVSKGYYGADNNWNSVVPTSSIFSLGSTSAVNGNTQTFIAYCFAEKKGFSKFGKYTGNGSADGTFVYTGFKPAFVMIKRTDGIDWWGIWDSIRNPSNAVDKRIYANTSGSEVVINNLDILSNGFKLRTTDGAINASGGTYIYMCFAENALVGTNNIPACAR